MVTLHAGSGGLRVEEEGSLTYSGASHHGRRKQKPCSVVVISVDGQGRNGDAILFGNRLPRREPGDYVGMRDHDLGLGGNVVEYLLGDSGEVGIPDVIQHQSGTKAAIHGVGVEVALMQGGLPLFLCLLGFLDLCLCPKSKSFLATHV